MPTAHATKKLPCHICGRSFPPSQLLPGSVLHGTMHDKICAQHPEWTDDCNICMDDLNHFRHEFIEEKLAEENGELTALQQEVMHSIKENELVIKDINAEFDSKLSFGDHIADKVAEFGGSWRFIISFLAILFIWLLINSLTFILKKPFDPFPFILLNLVLSCVAAIQAPVIMMSQNRQETKDRLRAEQDFKTNLKAELEVRNLNAKIDELLTHQWQRLLEIQQIQMDMIEQMTTHHQWEREQHQALEVPATSPADHNAVL